MAKTLIHYVCIGALIVLTYFLADSILSHRQVVLHGNAVAIHQPAPTGTIAKDAEIVALAMQNRDLKAAIEGKDVQLSAAQQTVSNAISAYTGVSGRMAGALAAGLSQGAPKAQVIELTTSAQPTKLQTAPAALTDDQIEKSLKKVLADTTIPVKLDSTVKVSWEDVPLSPIFAVYGSGGGSGLGYTLHKSPALDLDALALTRKYGTLTAYQFGLGVEHVIKNTSAGVGISALYDSGVHRVSPGVFVTIHFGGSH